MKYAQGLYLILTDRKEKTMHKNIKITTRICGFILLLAILLSLPILASADEAVTDDTTGAEAEADNSAHAPGGEENADGSESFFKSLFEAFEDNLSQILSALAFIGSLIIMLCYKRGLLPLVKDALAAIGAGVKKLGEKTNEMNIEAGAVTEQINGRLEDASRLLMAMEGALTTLTSRLDALESERDGRKKLCAVLSAEVDMLYEIFNSAALPQYLKDRVGERIAYMKAEISEMAHDEEV